MEERLALQHIMFTAVFPVVRKLIGGQSPGRDVNFRAPGAFSRSFDSIMLNILQGADLHPALVYSRASMTSSSVADVESLRWLRKSPTLCNESHTLTKWHPSMLLRSISLEEIAKKQKVM